MVYIDCDYEMVLDGELDRFLRAATPSEQAAGFLRKRALKEDDKDNAFEDFFTDCKSEHDGIHLVVQVAGLDLIDTDDGSKDYYKYNGILNFYEDPKYYNSTTEWKDKDEEFDPELSK
jgi:hypothetical protein